jgi:hypothetical protein
VDCISRECLDRTKSPVASAATAGTVLGKAVPAFGGDPLEVVRADFGEQFHTAGLNGGREQDGGRVRHQPAQNALALNQRQHPQIAAVQPENVERDELLRGPATHQVVELRPTSGVQEHDLAIQHWTGVAAASCSHRESNGR